MAISRPKIIARASAAPPSQVRPRRDSDAPSQTRPGRNGDAAVLQLPVATGEGQSACAVCGQLQFATPSGFTCAAGHGGADSVALVPTGPTAVQERPEGWYSLEEPDATTMDDAMNAVFEARGVPRLGGASGRGWSSYAAMQKCFHMYRRKYVDKVQGTPAAALETGSLLHALLAVYYMPRIEGMEGYPVTPEMLFEGVIQHGCRVERAMEAWRLFQAYESHYDNDYIRPLAVEELAIDPVSGNSCRYDGIVAVDENTPSVARGTWVLESKTASRFDTTVMDGWRNDGEIIGQIMVWQKAGLADKYGDLNGVIVNLVGKQKSPQFARIVIPVQAWQVEAHEAELKVWRALESVCRATGTWPRSRANCITRYGFCEFYDECSGAG